MFYLLYKHRWNTKPFHLNSSSGVKGAVYYVAIAKVIFSYVKIACYFHMWRQQVFARKLTWYFICVYIIKNDNLYNTLCFQNIDHFTCYFPFLEPEVDVQIVSVTSPTSQSILVKWQVNIRFILTNLFPCFSKDYHPIAIEVCGSFPRPPPPPPLRRLNVSDPKTHKWQLCTCPISSL